MNDGRDLSLLVELDQCLVRWDRGGTGGETEDERFVCGGCKVIYAARIVRARRCAVERGADRFAM